jgi:hypothetical protein
VTGPWSDVLLAPLGLRFDAWIYHPQLLELADLARAFGEALE